MGVAHLLRHTVDAYRSTEGKGTLDEPTRTWATNVAGLLFGLQQRNENRADKGPGEQTIGLWKGYSEPGVDVLSGDLIDVQTGDLAGYVGLLEVVAAYPPRGHHVQYDLREWEGALS